MLLLLPVLILIVGLFTLIFSNLRRPLRSSWLLSVGTAGVALLSLIFLRFRLPISLSFAGWWAGEGLEFSVLLLLDPASWILAFAVGALLMSSLLAEVSQAMTASWMLWARGLALAAAALFAILGGDLLTFAFSLTLFDLVLFVLVLTDSSWQRGREEAAHLIASLVGNMLLVAAWALPEFEVDAITGLTLIAAGLRLGLFLRPSPIPGGQAMGSMFQLAPLAPAIALLVRSQQMTLLPLYVVHLFLLLPAVFAALKYLNAKEEADRSYWTVGFGALALAAAAQGSSLAVLAFGLVLLFGEALLHAIRILVPKNFVGFAAIFGVVFLSGLPFTAGFPLTDFYTSSDSFVAYAYLPVHALLLLGWAQRAAVFMVNERPPESWMRTVQISATLSPPVVFVLFGIGAAPSFPPEQIPLGWWWGGIVLALVSFFALVAPRLQFRSPVVAAAESALSLSWLVEISRRSFAGLTTALSFVSSILEGPAGVLWAFLLIALLLSVVARAGLGI